jgi:hypothetical protein
MALFLSLNNAQEGPIGPSPRGTNAFPSEKMLTREEGPIGPRTKKRIPSQVKKRPSW